MNVDGEHFTTMNSFTSDSPLSVRGDIEKRSSSCDPSDRFSRRLTKYRIHQSDCQVKNDESFREFCEQESTKIQKLQNQKPNEGKQKGVSRRQPKKNNCSSVCQNISLWFE